MHAPTDSAVCILEIEARQDEALRQLEELEHRVEAALAESLPLAAHVVCGAQIAVTKPSAASPRS